VGVNFLAIIELSGRVLAGVFVVVWLSWVLCSFPHLSRLGAACTMLYGILACPVKLLGLETSFNLIQIHQPIMLITTVSDLLAQSL